MDSEGILGLAQFEITNLANHPVFSAPSATINATSGGQVSSLLIPAREVQLALKFYF